MKSKKKSRKEKKMNEGERRGKKKEKITGGRSRGENGGRKQPKKACQK